MAERAVSAQRPGPSAPGNGNGSGQPAPAAVYLDAASGAPLHPVAREALLAALDDGWADPDRLYGAGRRARLLLDAGRGALAESLDLAPDELSFTANGTQALHLAVLGTLRGARRPAEGPATFVHSAVEHSAVLHAAAQHQTAGGRSVAIGVDHDGRVDAAAFAAAGAAPATVAAALQLANHEVGTTQPDVELPVPLIRDATQIIGHAPLPARWDVLALDARTWGGPTLGALAVRTNTRWRSPGPEDERESGRVPGVPAVPAIVAAAASLRAVLAERDAEAARQRALVDRIRASVATLDDVEVLGDPTGRLPHIVTFSCLYVSGEALLSTLDRRGFAVSSGSSCTASTLEPSHVLVAMGALTSGNIRVSLHPGVSGADVERFLHALPAAIADVRAELGATGL